MMSLTGPCEEDIHPRMLTQNNNRPGNTVPSQKFVNERQSLQCGEQIRCLLEEEQAAKTEAPTVTRAVANVSG